MSGARWRNIAFLSVLLLFLVITAGYELSGSAGSDGVSATSQPRPTATTKRSPLTTRGQGVGGATTTALATGTTDGPGSGGGGGSGKPPQTSTTLSSNVKGLAAEAFDTVVMGKVAFNHPTSMRVGEATHIQARIARSAPDDLAEGLAGPGPVVVRGIEVSRYIRVKLLGPAFEITPLSSDDQLLFDKGYTQWEWSVIPKRSGRQYLYLRVTLRLDIPEHGPELVDRTVLNERIPVAVNLPYAIQQFVGANWQWAAGGATPIAVIVALGRYLRRRRDATDAPSSDSRDGQKAAGGPSAEPPASQDLREKPAASPEGDPNTPQL
jgi:hypothetical protein